MPTDLVIFGAGGYGREVRQVVSDVNAATPAWNLLGFLDADPARHGEAIRDLTVLGDRTWLADRPGTAVAVAIGAPAGRRATVAQLREAGVERFATLIHPRAWIGDHVTLGEGTIVLAGAAVSTDITIGAFACLNKNCIVGHDAVIGDHATISPGASISGFAQIGEGADIGANSVIVQGHRVGEWAVIGAGAVVTRDIEPNVTAVGVPARAIERRS